MAEKRQGFIHKIVQGSQVFHGHIIAAKKVCSNRKEQRRPVITLILKEMNAQRLGLHIISSII